MGLSEIPIGYMAHNTVGHVVVMESPKDKMSSQKKKMHILKKIKKRFGLVRRSPSSCPGPNNLPPLQFHSVHGANIRISRDGTSARRFESFCRAITFSARPVRINERICVRFTEISNNWNGGIRFGFTTNDPETLQEQGLPKYACPDLTNRPGFWAKALHEQYCEKDNILYYYVNTAGEVIYGINNEEKGVILSGIDTRGLLWTIIDIYGNCTAIEFLDARIYMYQQGGGANGGMSSLAGGVSGSGNMNTLPIAASQLGMNSHHHHHPNHQQSSRRSLPVEQDLERIVMPSMQSLNIGGDADLANGLPLLRYNANGRLIPVPFHITKGRNVRLSQDRFIASRTETDFCQGYVFTARPIRIGEKIIVQILKTEQMYVGALALGLTSCNPAALQPADLPNDSDFLLDRPEYWVVSKDIASTPQRGDEIAFFVAPNGEVSISKNNGPAVVVMHVDQSLQLWAFLDVYGSTQSVRMFRQQLPNMVSYPMAINIPAPPPQLPITATSTGRPHLAVNIPLTESINSLNSQISESRKTLQHSSQINAAATHSASSSNISASTSTLASLQSINQIQNGCGGTLMNGGSVGGSNRMISMQPSGDMIQIQPNGGGTVLVVNLPPAAGHSSSHDMNTVVSTSTLSASQGRLNQQTTTGVLPGACTSGTILSTANSQYVESISTIKNGNSNGYATNTPTKWKESAAADQHNSDTNSASAECTICYENQIDSVLYMCGHMCMCYDCAIEQWRGVGGGQCPLCRAVIRDVIRTYTT